MHLKTGKRPKAAGKPGRPESAPSVGQMRVLLEVIEVTGSDRAACIKARVANSSFHHWMNKGKESKAAGREDFWSQFLDQIEEARLDRLYKLEKVVRTAAVKEKHVQAAQWKLERLDPKQYGQRVKLQVEEELSEAIQRITERFGDRPELLEEVLSAVAGAHGAGGASEAPGGEDGTQLPGGEALHPPPPEPEAE